MKEKIILAIYKDKPIRSSEKFRYEIIRKFHIKDTELLNKLYRNIVNYQIKKYGKTLLSGYSKKTLEENARVTTNARTRKARRLKK